MDTVNQIVSDNIKRIRNEKKLSLDELSRLSGVSKSMLAQIERGDGNPSLSTLWKIANGMKVPFNVLIDRQNEPFEVVRISEVDPVLENKGAVRNYSVFPDDINRHFSIYYLQVDPGNAWQAEPHMKGTVEYVTVFRGSLEITVEGQEFILNQGDSLCFKADVPHAYRNISDTTVEFHNLLYNT
jgi:transcriptional regulator with XRE-family HTH domain